MMTANASSLSNSFGANVLRFYDELEVPHDLPDGIAVINPYESKEARKIMGAFFSRFFDDARSRIFVLGINPGRFGSGVTGIPFTDTVALREQCGIRSEFSDRRELTSQFVYRCIEEWGGAERFYQDFFLSAVSPVGFIRDGTNFNYYDTDDFFEYLKPYITRTLQEQLRFGAKRVAILLGTGKNQKAFTMLNNEFHFFDSIFTLEHPRFIMQYRRKDLEEYVKKYNATFARALSSAA